MLVVKRFDRHWINQQQLMRVPQEDFCQILSIMPDQKYQSDGGPGMLQILDILRASDQAQHDRHTFLQMQILFWLLAAIDGHAKNFSVFIYPGASFRLTPIYDVLSVQPYLENSPLHPRKIKFAMSYGDHNHYKLAEIRPRHIMQTAKKAGFTQHATQQLFDELYAKMRHTLTTTREQLQGAVDDQLMASIAKGVAMRMAMPLK